MQYEILENGAVKITPSIESEGAGWSMIQRQWPDGTPWSSGEAEQWALDYIEAYTNENTQFRPGTSPNEPRIPKPTDEERLSYEQSLPVQLTQAELEALIQQRISEASK